MRIKFGTVIVIAGFAGLQSFSFLLVALGSNYWYIIEVKNLNQTHSGELNSHSGLWRMYEGKSGSAHAIYSFSDSANYSDPELHLHRMHRVIVILLPLSLVLLVIGGICGLVSSLAQSSTLLIGSASYFFICTLCVAYMEFQVPPVVFQGVLTLSGVTLYLSYSQQALEELQRQVGSEHLAYVRVYFGWSLGLACLSFILEILTGTLLLLAARITCLQCHRNLQTLPWPRVTGTPLTPTLPLWSTAEGTWLTPHTTIPGTTKRLQQNMNSQIHATSQELTNTCSALRTAKPMKCSRACQTTATEVS